MLEKEYIVGIDEVGRGALAGPVGVGLVMIEKEIYQKIISSQIFPAGRDSKKLSPRKREFFAEKVAEMEMAGELNFAVCYSDREMIDEWGIVQAIQKAIYDGLKNLNCDNTAEILLDGGLNAPAGFKNQKAIIRGDEKELIIALASIVAKVARDKKMVSFAEQFPAYSFEQHKGYGTKKHYEALAQSGLCPLHRRSYCRRIK
jgi:ribonuclease HII